MTILMLIIRRIHRILALRTCLPLGEGDIPGVARIALQQRQHALALQVW
jgi:hypothetical protein